MTDNDQGTVYRKVTVGAGNVLRLMGVFRDLNTAPATAPSVNYAQCVNYKNEVLFLPFSAEGRFYSAASRPTASLDHVFLMSQLLRQQRPPVTVKLVCGFMPRMPCNFTGLLCLQEVRPERLVLGCTTDPDAPSTLFELNADATLRLQPVDPLDRRTSQLFTKALVTCERQGHAWRHQMKVSHDVFDASPPAGRRLQKTPSLSERSVGASPPGAPPARRLVKSNSLDGERRPGRSLRQTVSRFFLSRGRSNRDVSTSFVFSRPCEVQYGDVADAVAPAAPPSPAADNLYAEICEHEERPRPLPLPPSGDYTLRLGSDGHSSSPSSPGDTLHHSTC
ncbi:uncharacterized protein LOC119110066 [Pollicipes pollicipes]|uniref:uncharacterized protein LOC119110066 n=1 Tax=Pollicipes pollicipes TaxID=41117 RepID=UPI0018857842|nr:uncharacterized protein LOC119110066 [Pollicipes pollicipes]